jgi:hypothetical protein
VLQCCGKFVWPNDLPEDWDVTWNSAGVGLDVKSLYRQVVYV